MNLIKRLRTRPTGDPHLHALVHEAADEIERQTNNADNLRQRVEDLTKECDALKTVMVAAAEEIQAHWSAHCDAEGYGPANLIRRLEEGIPSEYGYTAGAFERLTKERDALRELMNCYNLGGWTDAERLQKERDEARAERDALQMELRSFSALRRFAHDVLGVYASDTDSAQTKETVVTLRRWARAAIDAAMKEKP